MELWIRARNIITRSARCNRIDVMPPSKQIMTSDTAVATATANVVLTAAADSAPKVTINSAPAPKTAAAIARNASTELTNEEREILFASSGASRRRTTMKLIVIVLIPTVALLTMSSNAFYSSANTFVVSTRNLNVRKHHI